MAAFIWNRTLLWLLCCNLIFIKVHFYPVFPLRAEVPVDQMGWFGLTVIWANLKLDSNYSNTQILNSLKILNCQPWTMNPVMLKINTWGLSWTEALLDTHTSSLSLVYFVSDMIQLCTAQLEALSCFCFVIHVCLTWKSYSYSPDCSLICSAQLLASIQSIRKWNSHEQCLSRF